MDAQTGPNRFNENKSAPVSDLVLEDPQTVPQQPTENEAVAARADYPPRDPDRQAPSPQQSSEDQRDQSLSTSTDYSIQSSSGSPPNEDDDADNDRELESPSSPLLDRGNQSGTPCDDGNSRKNKIKNVILIICACIAVFLALIISGLVAAYIIEININVPHRHSNHYYTRTDMYTLLGRFTCPILTGDCDISKVNSTALVKPDSITNKVKIVVIKCGDVKYQNLNINSNYSDYSETNKSNFTVPIIDDSYYTSNNFFNGTVKISVQATALHREESQPPVGQVDVCSFDDLSEYKKFLSPERQWIEYAERATCKMMTVQGNGTTYNSTVFTLTNIAPTFIGAVQTNAYYHITFAYSIIDGKTISGIKQSNVSWSCTLYVKDKEHSNTCSIDVNDSIVESAGGSELCVLGRGAGYCIPTCVYTDIAIDLIPNENFILTATHVRLT